MSNILKCLTLYVAIKTVSAVVKPEAPTFPKLKWVLASEFELNHDKNEPAGYQQRLDMNLWVGRALYKGGLIIGYYGHEAFYFPFENDEGKMGRKSKRHGRSDLSGRTIIGDHGIAVDHVQVLSYPPGAISWQPKKTGDLKFPANIVLGGIYPETKEQIFVCRGLHGGNKVLVGFYRLREDNCVVSFDSNSVTLNDFEVMSLNFYGMSSGVGSPN